MVFNKIEKLEQAIQAYIDRKVDLRSGALMAGVSYNRFMSEVVARNTVILEEDGFLERLEFLAEAFDDNGLRNAAAELRSEAETAHLLQSPANATHLACSIEQYRNGKVTERALIDE